MVNTEFFTYTSETPCLRPLCNITLHYMLISWQFFFSKEILSLSDPAGKVSANFIWHRTRWYILTGWDKPQQSIITFISGRSFDTKLLFYLLPRNLFQNNSVPLIVFLLRSPPVVSLGVDYDTSTTSLQLSDTYLLWSLPLQLCHVEVAAGDVIHLNP